MVIFEVGQSFMEEQVFSSRCRGCHGGSDQAGQTSQPHDYYLVPWAVVTMGGDVGRRGGEKRDVRKATVCARVCKRETIVGA